MFAKENTCEKKQSNIFGLKNFFSTKYSSTKPTVVDHQHQGYEKKKKSRKGLVEKNMDLKRKPNYADTAYKEAVSKLKYFLSENYNFPARNKAIMSSELKEEESDNQSLINSDNRSYSKFYISNTLPFYYPNKNRKYYLTNPNKIYTNTNKDSYRNTLEDFKIKRNDSIIAPEIMKFIEKQEEYIKQLEKETNYCKEELADLVRKLKTATIPENDSSASKHVFENVKDQQNNYFSVSSHKSFEGPSIIFESRISELEAQLTQMKIELKKTKEENEELRSKNYSENQFGNDEGVDNFRKKLETVEREKLLLQDSVMKLQQALSLMKDKEFDTTDQMKRSLNAAEHANYEKNAAEQEIRRLRDELDRQHLKIREIMSDQTRRMSDERNSIERRYSQQIEQLTAELGAQWEITNKLQLEVEKLRRGNADLRREIAQKNAYIDDIRKEMQTKIANSISSSASLRSESDTTGAEKNALEEQVATLQSINERNERQLKQETFRLQAEIQSLRQRLDRSDSDLLHCRKENIRLTDQIVSIEKQISLNSVLNEERRKNETNPSPIREEVINNSEKFASMLKETEDRHAMSVVELESMIKSQNQLMEKLTNECRIVNDKVEDTSTRHMEEIRQLHASLDFLTSRLSQNQFTNKDKTQDNQRTYTNAPSTLIEKTEENNSDYQNLEKNEAFATIHDEMYEEKNEILNKKPDLENINELNEEQYLQDKTNVEQNRYYPPLSEDKFENDNSEDRQGNVNNQKYAEDENDPHYTEYSQNQTNDEIDQNFENTIHRQSNNNEQYFEPTQYYSEESADRKFPENEIGNIDQSNKQPYVDTDQYYSNDRNDDYAENDQQYLHEEPYDQQSTTGPEYYDQQQYFEDNQQTENVNEQYVEKEDNQNYNQKHFDDPSQYDQYYQKPEDETKNYQNE